MSKHNVDFVTLYSDATFRDSYRGHPIRDDRRKAAYAFWLRSDGGKHTEYKVCPVDIINSNQAEIYAICQGIYIGMKRWPETKGFYITSDSQNALSRLERPLLLVNSKGKPIHDVELRLKKKFDSMVKEYGIKVIFRWVRGHSGGVSTPSWLNKWCDSMGRKAIKEHDKSLICNKKLRSGV